MRLWDFSGRTSSCPSGSIDIAVSSFRLEWGKDSFPDILSPYELVHLWHSPRLAWPVFQPKVNDPFIVTRSILTDPTKQLDHSNLLTASKENAKLICISRRYI